VTTKQADRHSFALIDDDREGSQVLAQTLIALAAQVAEALGCSECCIYEYLPDRRALRAQAIWAEELTDRDRDWIGRVNHLADLPGFDAVVSSREILISHPEDDADAGMRGAESMGYWGELAALYAPIVREDEVLGILELTEKHTRREFSEADQRLVSQMAGLAAIALANARESRAAEARSRLFGALIDASRAMTSSLDLDEVLDVICRQAALALDAGSSYIYEYDRDANTMIWVAHYQRDPDHSFEEPLGSVYALEDLPQDRAVIETRKPVEVRLDDPDLDPEVREQLLEWEEKASLMVPMIVGNDIVGALEVSEADTPRHFTPEETALCTALGEQAAAAFRNARLYRQLQDQKEIIELQATTDGLTGLFNHRHFFERLRAEVTRARRYGLVLSLLMLDLDDFKNVNDQFGHPAGDDVLHAVSDVIRGQLRQNLDIPARYGGEEFAVILPHTGTQESDADLADGARTTGERIRRAIAEMELPIDQEGPPVHITASVGLAMLPAHAEDADELVSKADQALYRAKRAGKDRVEVFAWE
jgi:diguanylate cyclase (GGDEF)-like protein